MRSVVVWACCSAAFLCIIAARPAPAQQEVYHPGETYDSLQAGQDAYWDAEAQRRALIGRQLMIQEQVMLQNTRSDPQDRSYGYVRQPIGHVKIWTGRLSYIYKPIYASPPLETARSVPAAALGQRRRMRVGGSAPQPVVTGGFAQFAATAAKTGGSGSQPA